MKLKYKILTILVSLLLTSCFSNTKPLKNALGKTRDMNRSEILKYDKMYEGIFINDIDIKDLSKEEIIKKITQNLSEDGSFKLQYNDFNQEVKFKDIDFSYDYNDIVNQAFNIGRIGNDDDRIALLQNLLKTPKKLYITYKYNHDKINKIIDEVCEKINIPASDETVNFKNGKVNIVEGKNGIEVNKLELLTEIKKVSNDTIINIPVNIVEHKSVDKSYLNSIKGVIGEATTYFDAYDNNRNTNIMLSAKKVNELILMPNQTFSFVSYVNDITSANGYKTAGTFVNDKIVDAIGGGICQVTSTLYQAALKADMKIVERQQHSQRVSYCTIGLDSMFYSGSSDLKFKNTFNFPVLILSEITNNSITFKFLGDTSIKNYDIKLFTDNVSTIPMPIEEIPDENLPIGKKVVVEKGYPGYRGTSYIQKGNEKPRVLNSDYYHPKKQIVKIGSKKEEKDKTDKDKEDKVQEINTDD